MKTFLLSLLGIASAFVFAPVFVSAAEPVDAAEQQRIIDSVLCPAIYTDTECDEFKSLLADAVRDIIRHMEEGTVPGKTIKDADVAVPETSMRGFVCDEDDSLQQCLNRSRIGLGIDFTGGIFAEFADVPAGDFVCPSGMPDHECNELVTLRGIVEAIAVSKNRKTSAVDYFAERRAESKISHRIDLLQELRTLRDIVQQEMRRDSFDINKLLGLPQPAEDDSNQDKSTGSHDSTLDERNTIIPRSMQPKDSSSANDAEDKSDDEVTEGWKQLIDLKMKAGTSATMRLIDSLTDREVIRAYEEYLWLIKEDVKNRDANSWEDMRDDLKEEICDRDEDAKYLGAYSELDLEGAICD